MYLSSGQLILVERYTELGLEGKHFDSGNSLFLFLENEKEAAKLRWAGGAQRPVWRVMSQKRQVRAGHGRERAAKAHQSDKKNGGCVLCTVLYSYLVWILESHRADMNSKCAQGSYNEPFYVLKYTGINTVSQYVLGGSCFYG
jgi:hypothetical protein